MQVPTSYEARSTGDYEHPSHAITAELPQPQISGQHHPSQGYLELPQSQVSGQEPYAQGRNEQMFVDARSADRSAQFDEQSVSGADAQAYYDYLAQQLDYYEQLQRQQAHKLASNEQAYDTNGEHLSIHQILSTYQNPNGEQAAGGGQEYQWAESALDAFQAMQTESRRSVTADAPPQPVEMADNAIISSRERQQSITEYQVTGEQYRQTSVVEPPAAQPLADMHGGDSGGRPNTAVSLQAEAQSKEVNLRRQEGMPAETSAKDSSTATTVGWDQSKDREPVLQPDHGTWAWGHAPEDHQIPATKADEHHQVTPPQSQYNAPGAGLSDKSGSRQGMSRSTAAKQQGRIQVVEILERAGFLAYGEIERALRTVLSDSASAIELLRFLGLVDEDVLEAVSECIFLMKRGKADAEQITHILSLYKTTGTDLSELLDEVLPEWLSARTPARRRQPQETTKPLAEAPEAAQPLVVPQEAALPPVAETILPTGWFQIGSSVLVGQEPYAPEVRVQEPAVEDTQAQEEPVREPAVEDAQAQEVRVQEPAVEDAQAQEEPVRELAVEDAQAQEEPVREPAVEDAQAQEEPVREPAVEDAQAQEERVQEPAVEDAQAQEEPVREPAVEDTQAQEEPVREPAVEDTQAQEEPVVDQTSALMDYPLLEKPAGIESASNMIAGVEQPLAHPEQSQQPRPERLEKKTGRARKKNAAALGLTPLESEPGIRTRRTAHGKDEKPLPESLPRGENGERDEKESRLRSAMRKERRLQVLSQSASR